MSEQDQHYSIVIQWENGVYVASVPELPGCATHGDTYQEALERVLEVMAEWLDLARERGVPIPVPRPLGQAVA
ncbi:MAG TPA: type II toxin-antitoxin system HicB family antitoxin [Thermomicrobiales bacterium]|nr:type II toxin-antitoxin system HicB family antitoxin [Thermomicrobiales bacterium]